MVSLPTRAILVVCLGLPWPWAGTVQKLESGRNIVPSRRGARARRGGEFRGRRYEKVRSRKKTGRFAPRQEDRAQPPWNVRSHDSGGSFASVSERGCFPPANRVVRSPGRANEVRLVKGKRSDFADHVNQKKSLGPPPPLRPAEAIASQRTTALDRGRPAAGL